MGAIISIFAIGLVFLCGALAGQPHWQPARQAEPPVTATPQATAEGAAAADKPSENNWQDALGELAADLGGMAADLAARATDALDHAAQSLQDSLPGALEQAKQSASQLADNLRDSASEARDSLGDWLDSLRSG